MGTGAYIFFALWIPSSLLIVDLMRFREEIGESLTLKFAESARLHREKNLPITSQGVSEPHFEAH